MASRIVVTRLTVAAPRAVRTCTFDPIANLRRLRRLGMRRQEEFPDIGEGEPERWVKEEDVLPQVAFEYYRNKLPKVAGLCLEEVGTALARPRE